MERHSKSGVGVHSGTAQRPWQTYNIVSVNVPFGSSSASSSSSSSKSVSVRGNRVRARPSSAYPERRSRSDSSRYAPNHMAVTSFASNNNTLRGRRSQRPSSAPRQRVDHESRRVSASDKSTNAGRTLLVKNTLGHSSYTGAKTEIGYSRAQEGVRRRARPQSAALCGRRRGAVERRSHDRSNLHLRHHGVKERGSAESGSLGRRNTDGMIIVKQWRPEGGWKGIDGIRRSRQRQKTKRPQTALGTRRRTRRPGL